MMTTMSDITRCPFSEENTKLLSQISPIGWSVGLNVAVLAVEVYYVSFPAGWVDRYSRLKLMIVDPVLHHIAFSNGVARWSELKISAINAPAKLVMKEAAKFGLNYGFAIAQNNPVGGSKCFLTAAREDREFTDAELKTCSSILANEIDLFNGSRNQGLTSAEIAVLKLAAEGQAHAEIAEHLDISKEAVKKRLERAREKLDAKNAVHACILAQKQGLI